MCRAFFAPDFFSTVYDIFLYETTPLRVAILRNDIPTDGHADYPQLFKELLASQESVDFQVFDARQDEFPTCPSDFDGFIITGSRHAVYERDQPWIDHLLERIRSLYKARIPIVGVCFGHQAVAKALGGEVAKNEAGWEVGVVHVTVDPTAAELVPRLKANPSFDVVSIHQDHVLRMPAGFVSLGSTSISSVQGMLDVLGRVLTFQGHPEVPKGCLAHVLQHDGSSTIPQTTRVKALHSLNSTVSTDLLTSLTLACFHRDLLA
mmetsp:Transcript_3953/g.6952  ORF Transcript_3953/g.6952 Transcript_3953/m.6952 type:complete len:263 (-) Transcript_3953:53-841(-)|eukprot:CAMPEP_0196657770 /NCGR_PEP_ID=MMETSP1086-20130531/25416_1 /TAXON_ID=77921 /ORGANISM="Cyanoptyche  gloeocystis , Strain SAG4.97" /LENGTH=262 /DNA_ID=CAMNT_0041991035 /DNA_START=142 /DNA_END=930 /DNA_ORIENTATION=+